MSRARARRCRLSPFGGRYVDNAACEHICSAVSAIGEGTGAVGSIRSSSANADCLKSSRTGARATRVASRAAARPTPARASRVIVAAASPAIPRAIARARSPAISPTATRAAAQAAAPAEPQAASRAAARPAAHGAHAAGRAAPRAQTIARAHAVRAEARQRPSRSRASITGARSASRCADSVRPAAASHLGAYVRISQSSAIHERASSRPSSCGADRPREIRAQKLTRLVVKAVVERSCRTPAGPD